VPGPALRNAGAALRRRRRKPPLNKLAVAAKSAGYIII
jgi:hypothetical protein